MDKIWLSSPHMGGTEQNYVNQAFQSNWVAPLGPNVTGFETDLEQYLGNEKHVSVLSSGTAALHLALVQLGVKAGDVVLCQSFTFCASANPITYLGAEPVFIDSEQDTWNICPEFLEKAIVDITKKGKKIKAIIPVHLYGMPAKMHEILAIANKYTIPIIEDSAEALGSLYKGQKCGTFGTFSVLSFNGNKIITTSGGGALVCKNEIDKNKTTFLATQARDHAPHYEHSVIGYNYRMSNISAGIGRGQMEVVDKHVLLRRSMHSFYKELFKENKKITLFTEPNENYYSNHWLSAVLLENYEKREALRIAFEKENIETRPLWKPMHLQPVFKDCLFYGADVSEKLFERGLCLPSGSNTTDAERKRIEKVIVNFDF
jgi:dTDP-4-amino-4,6-dideoxygalactose transaminase